jgi:16S rRNA (uracil1498-N3)-methyltransferase
MITTRTVVKLDAQRAGKKQIRWQNVAEAAAKQSKRAMIPEIDRVMNFREALQDARENDVNLIPYEQETDISRTRTLIRTIQKGQSVGVFVGPEGGFEESEIEAAKAAGVRPITLGRRILRAETACITILSILMYELDR